MKLVVAGGGTGGHFFPSLALLKEARERKIDTLYVGSLRGIEKSLEAQIPGEKVFLEVYPLRGVGVRDRLKAVKSFVKASLEIRKHAGNASSAIIFGGYASVPTALYALFRGIPLYIHEQNSVPSMTNRTFSLFAKKVFITFEYTRRYFKGKHVIKTGLPVRKELIETKMDKEKAREALGIDPSPPVILFMGGSQGARFINNLAVDFARKTGVKTILLSGTQDHDRIRELAKGVENLFIYPFRTDMGIIYSSTDIAVCRAGAGTLTELSLFGVPAVMIPYPYAAGDHQYYNAKEIEDLGGGLTLRQEEVTTERVIELIDRIINSIEGMITGISSFSTADGSSAILKEIL